MLLNTETLMQICHKNQCNSKCPLEKTGLCDEVTPFEINWDAVQDACKKYEFGKTYRWVKIDDAINMLEDKHYYLADIDYLSTPIKVKFIDDAEVGFECDICHERKFIPLSDNKVKYITNLPELPKEDE